MKRLSYISVIGLLLFALAFPAYNAISANLNIANPDTGTTFRGPTVTGSGEHDIPVGMQQLTVLHSDITTAATEYVVIDLTDYRIERIRASMEGQIGNADATINFWHLDTDGNMVGEVTNAVAPMQIGTDAATGSSVTPWTAGTTQSNNFFTRGHVLAIQTDGGGTNSVGARFVITIRPR